MERRKRKSSVEEYLDRLMENPEKVQRCSEFHMNLRTFYKKRWNCRLKSPHIQGVEVDLFRLYDTVISMGGWQKVSFNEKWGDIAHAIGLANGVAVAEHAIKVLYMRYLSKYEQNELVGEVDDADSDLLSSRSRGKGFSSLATADCPISTGQRQASEYFRLRPEKKEAEYDRIVKSLLSGLPNEVDFAVNVCTLLSHPGPRVLRLVAAPQIITLLVAHLAIFPDGDRAFYDLYKSWELVSGHNFIAFWSGAGITDDEVLKLIPHIKPSMVDNIFCGLDTEFQPRNVVSWRVQQVLLIIRNLSFEVINKAVLAASWPLLKFLFICSNCKWSMLRTAALDALSNIACEIDLMAEESSSTNHLLLKTVSCCLHSDDKFRVIRALEILSGLCNNERNESLICEFLDHRILSKIFTVISVKDIMMCVYTLESLYQISELGATACYQLSRFPHAIDTLVSLATVEAVSFGPSGLIGMKVVEFHGPSQLAPPPPQNVPISQNQAVRPGSFATPTHSTSYSSRMVTPRGTSNTSTPVIGDSKVEQLTAKWIRMNCVFEMGSVVPRGELYASYVDDLRHRYGALSGSLAVSTNTDSHASLVANHPLVQKMLTDNANSPAILNGHTTVTVVATAAAIDKKYSFLRLMFRTLQILNIIFRHFSSASFVLYHCTKEHVGDDHSIQCHWPRCDSTVRAKWSMVTHLQDHHCNEAALKAAAKRRKEGPVNPERPREIVQHPGYSKNAAVEAIRRHAFNYLPRDITDDPEGPVTKSIRLTSCLILRNLARYSNDGRRLLRRHERLLSWLSLSRVESSSALAQLLAELYSQPSSSSSPFCSSSSLSPHRTYHVPTALNAVTLAKAL
uniref:BMA-SWSN-7 n=1 Tax=Brugia malayi TaxID=6279 RepID=A0A0J9XN01_BRUMA|nr:BMA-SWSN-7 [Brugia malayi]